MIANHTVALHWLHASHLTDLRDVAVTKHSIMFGLLGTADVMGMGRTPLPGRFFLLALLAACLTWNRRHGMTNLQEPQQEPTQCRT